MLTVEEAEAGAQAAPMSGVAGDGTVTLPPASTRVSAGPRRRRKGPGGVDANPPSPPHHSPASPGLVLSSTTVRINRPSTRLGLDGTVTSPTAADVKRSAAAFGPSPWGSLAEESPLPRLYVTPGALIVSRTSARQLVRAAELEQLRRIATVNAGAVYGVADEVYSIATRLPVEYRWSPDPVPVREVTGFSAKSRANMVKAFASLDWSPIHSLADVGRIPAMVTLTYPGADWVKAAPDGVTVKRHFHILLRRWSRAWEESAVCAWKLEFQRRGAPHLHIFLVPPHGLARAKARERHERELAAWEEAGRCALLRFIALGEPWASARRKAFLAIGRQPRWREADGDGLPFTHWLSVNWANTVSYEGQDPAEYQKHLAAGTAVDFAEALKCSDPKRLSLYFGKHGLYRDKEYQHIVPEAWRDPGTGPGRFWGYWGLSQVAIPAELTVGNYLLATRILRRYATRVRVRACNVTGSPCPGQVHELGCGWRYVRAMAGFKAPRRDVDQVTGEVIWRKHRRRSRVRRFTSGGGFLLVNDAPALAHQLARAIAVCGDRP
jgi:hypothetical protein